MRHRLGLCGLIIVVGLLAVPVQAQSTPPVVFAGVQVGQVSLFTFEPDSGILRANRLPIPPGISAFDHLSWSPDGLILSFTQQIDPHLEFEPARTELIFAPQLPDHHPYIVETSLARNLQAFFAPQFDASGLLTYVVRPPEDVIYQDDDFQGVILDVYQRLHYAGAPPQLIGQIVYGYGCGHTPNSPMEALQDAEGALDSVIAATPYGIVFSPYCVGRGLAISTNDQFTLLHNDLHLIVIAPDQASLAGWDGTTQAIVWFDLATRTATTCPVADEVTHIAWAGDGGSLYYGTRYPTGTFTFTPEESATLNAIIPLAESLTARYGVDLYRLTPATCAAERLYSNPDAYAISRIAPLDDRIFFSEIENGDAWFAQLLADGARNWEREQTLRDIVAINLYHMPFGEDAQMIGQGIEQATFMIGSQ